MNKDRLNVYNNYIEKYSPSGFKSGLKYAACFYIGATVACLIAGFISPLLLIFGAIDLANLLILPLAMLITNPVAWAAIGVIFIVASGVAMSIAKPFFYLTKDLINERRAQKKENGEEKDIKLQALQDSTPEGQKTPDRDSVLEEDKDSFVTATNKGNYECWLSNFNIEDVARIVYGYSPDGIKNDVLFASCITDCYPQGIKAQLKKYKQEAGKNHNLIFAATLHLHDKKHFATLVVFYDEENTKFKAYYCDSYFNSPLPDKVSDTIQEILNVEKGDIRSYYTKQQTNTHDCAIFALENCDTAINIIKKHKRITRENKSLEHPNKVIDIINKLFHEIDSELSRWKPSQEELKNKRIEFAEALKKDEQSIVSVLNEGNRRSSVASSVSSESGISVGSEESKQTQRTEVKKYNTAGDGNNCFFHAVFGINNFGPYRAEKAGEMGEEWYKLLSQFESLKDPKMPTPLKEQLQKVFNMFLNKPEDLTGRSGMIKGLVEQTKKKIENVEDNVKALISEIVNSSDIPQNEAISDLKTYAQVFYPELTEEEYNEKYNSETITNSFLNDEILYKSYLEAIKEPYQVFIEEIPILASLAGIKIMVHYKDNGDNVHKVFKPNPEMMKMNMFDEVGEVHTEVYKRNGELWGDKKQETIYLKPGHYERAEVVPLTPPPSRTESVSSLKSVVSYCPIM